MEADGDRCELVSGKLGASSYDFCPLGSCCPQSQTLDLARVISTWAAASMRKICPELAGGSLELKSREGSWGRQIQLNPLPFSTCHLGSSCLIPLPNQGDLLEQKQGTKKISWWLLSNVQNVLVAHLLLFQRCCHCTKYFDNRRTWL